MVLYLDMSDCRVTPAGHAYTVHGYSIGDALPVSTRYIKPHVNSWSLPIVTHALVNIYYKP